MNLRIHIVLLFALFIFMAASQIWLAYQRYDLNLDMNQTNKQQQKLQQEIQGLNLELASLTRPERLRIHAQNKLGMAPPKPMQVVHP